MENENTTNETQDLILDNLRTLNENTVANNVKLSNIEKLLTEQYEHEQEKEKAQEKKEAEQSEADATATAERDASNAEQTETFEEILTETRDNITLTNSIFAGQICFLGIIAGILLGKILFDRFFKA